MVLPPGRLFAVVLALPLLLAGQNAPAQQFMAGVAVIEITPPAGYRMSGYFNERLNTGTHDPLQAKAVVFKQADTVAALVFCDLIGISRSAADQTRRRASQRTGIPASHILVHGTHSHTGPLFEGALRNHFHEQAVKKHGRDPHEAVEYVGFLSQCVADAVAEAQARLQPVSLAAGAASQRGLSFNRRFHMKDGSVVFNPGKLNPNIIRPAGPIDPDVGLVFIKSAANGQNLGAVVNFALHLDTVGGTEYAADYPFYLERTLRQHLGNQFVALFGNGTCGDINHIDVTHGRAQKGHDEAARIGTALAETVRAQIPSLAEVAPQLAVRSGMVEAALQRFSAEEIEQAGRNVFKVGTAELSFLEQVTAVKILNAVSHPGPTLPVEVQVFRLSDDLAIVGLPGEVFVDLGLAIKRASPFARTLVIELCNDNPAYIPTAKAFAEGSYETVNSIIAPGGGERMVELAVQLLKEVKSAPNTAGAPPDAAIELFNGQNLEGWRDKTGEWMAAGGAALDPQDPAKFAIEPGTGTLVNGKSGKTVNLVSLPEFGDVEAHGRLVRGIA